jgi:DNA-binding response OmpR family regulator
MNNEPLMLTFTEFRLLQFFISRPNQVYSRTQIMEKLNGIDYFAMDCSVDVQVTGLRKKLGPYKTHLETVPGVGDCPQE